MKIKNQILKLMLTLVLAFSIFSCEDEGNNEIITKLPTSNELINADLANYSVLRKSLEVTGLLGVITGSGAYTIFAPDNTAFATYNTTNFPTGISLATFTDVSVTPNVPITLNSNQLNELKRTLMYHIVSGASFASDLPNKNYIKTFAPYGTSTSITLSAYVDKTNGVTINGGVANTGAVVTLADIKASNGVIHKINAVMKLPTLITQLNCNSDLSSFLTNLNADTTAKGFVTAPANNTQLFVPNNDAFTNAATVTYLTGKTPSQIAEIIKFHITTGSKYDRNAVVGTQTGQFQNDGAATTTSYLPTTAITNATVATKTNAILPATGVQNFFIQKNSLNIIEIIPPVAPATMPTENVLGKLKTTNIHTFNGIIHIIDTVLKPVL